MPHFCHFFPHTLTETIECHATYQISTTKSKSKQIESNKTNFYFFAYLYVTFFELNHLNSERLCIYLISKIFDNHVFADNVINKLK